MRIWCIGPRRGSLGTSLIPLARRILSEEELNNLGLQWAIRRGIRL